ncbi:hypothetical protein Slin15195_G126700 [Septoria linicola]|uniref:Uncharacterized protein n=1 Tax=Septoria linicola TaxID=215465 RepID=A0A9Q9BAG6_9PEZI|nr:hypothetical protein Slin15195_G126700 [Septoria linicola]
MAEYPSIDELEADELIAVKINGRKKSTTPARQTSTAASSSSKSPPASDSPKGRRPRQKLHKKLASAEVTISKFHAQITDGDEPDLLQWYQSLKRVVLFQQLYAQFNHDGDHAAARVCKNHAQELMAGGTVTANERKEPGDQFKLMKAASAEQLATIIDDAAKKAECSEEDIARA